MLALKTISFLLGIAFTLFGYFIRFRGKYNLINGFEANFKQGRKTEEYAKRVGRLNSSSALSCLSSVCFSAYSDDYCF